MAVEEAKNRIQKYKIEGQDALKDGIDGDRPKLKEKVRMVVDSSFYTAVTLSTP